MLICSHFLYMECASPGEGLELDGAAEFGSGWVSLKYELFWVIPKHFRNASCKFWAEISCWCWECACLLVGSRQYCSSACKIRVCEIVHSCKSSWSEDNTRLCHASYIICLCSDGVCIWQSWICFIQFAKGTSACFGEACVQGNVWLSKEFHTISAGKRVRKVWRRFVDHSVSMMFSSQW